MKLTSPRLLAASAGLLALGLVSAQAAPRPDAGNLVIAQATAPDNPTREGSQGSAANQGTSNMGTSNMGTSNMGTSNMGSQPSTTGTLAPQGNPEIRDGNSRVERRGTMHEDGKGNPTSTN